MRAVPARPDTAAMPLKAGWCTPLVHVRDVAASIRFYEKLGFQLIDTEGDDDSLGWARVHCEGGALMFVPSEHEVKADQQGVLFYLYTEDLAKTAAGNRCLVLRAITHFGAIFQVPGIVELKVAGYTAIECGPRPAIAEAIAGAFSACALDGRVTDRIADEMWRKVIVNCVINPIRP